MFHSAILMVVLTRDNAIRLLDTAGVLTRPEENCHAPAPVGNQHVIKMPEMGHVVRGTYYVLVVGKSMAKQRQFLCQNVDQMVAMPPSSVINPLASAGALTRMAMNLWGLEQTEDVLAELKLARRNVKMMLMLLMHGSQPVIKLVVTSPGSAIKQLAVAGV